MHIPKTRSSFVPSVVFLFAGILLLGPTGTSECRADLIIDHSSVSGSTWALNPNNVLGVRFYQGAATFSIEGVNLFVGTSSATPITADFSIVEFDSMTDTTGNILVTLNSITVASQFPTNFATDATFVDFSSFNLELEKDRIYGIVAHNPSSGLLIGAVDNSDPIIEAAAITSGSFPGSMSGAAGQDMAFQAFGTTSIPEPHEFALFAVWVGVILFVGNRWYKKRMESAVKSTAN